MVSVVVPDRSVCTRLKSMTLPDSVLTSGARISKWNLEGRTVPETALGLFCQSPITMYGCVVACRTARILAMMVALVSLWVLSLVRRYSPITMMVCVVACQRKA